MCGTAFKNKGVQALLDAIIEFMPSPIEMPAVKGIDEHGEPDTRTASDDEPFAALAFKILNDPFVGNLTFFRVYSGTLNSGDTVYVPSKDKKERIGRLLQMHASERTEIKEVRAGDIAAAVGLKDVITGDTLCDLEKVITLEKMVFPDAGHLGGGRAENQGRPGEDGPRPAAPREGRSFVPRVHRPGVGPDHHHRHGRAAPRDHRRPHEARVQGRGERRQAAGRLSRDHRGKVESEGKFVRQSGGRGQYGHVWLKLEPNEPGKGNEFVNGIVGGTVPREFIPAIEKGIKEAVETGVMAGYPVVDVKVTAFDGSYHDVDSNEMAFKIAGSMGFKDGFRKAKPVLLEPIMKVEVVTPEEYSGDVIGDLNRRRGQIMGMEDGPSGKAVTAEVPLSEMFGYATTVRSMSQGRATFTMEFEKYVEVPPNIADTIIKN